MRASAPFPFFFRHPFFSFFLRTRSRRRKERVNTPPPPLPFVTIFFFLSTERSESPKGRRNTAVARREGLPSPLSPFPFFMAPPFSFFSFRGGKIGTQVKKRVDARLAHRPPFFFFFFSHQTPLPFSFSSPCRRRN